MRNILVFLLYSLLLNYNFASAAASDYAKSVVGQGGAVFALSNSSKSVMHVFDAMPKMALYKYTGSEYKDIYKIGLNRGNDKARHGTVVYPQHTTNRDHFTLFYPLKTAQDGGTMLVEIEDMDLAGVGYKTAVISTQDVVFNIAERLNQDFNLEHQVGMRPVTSFKGIDKAYIEFKPNEKSHFKGVMKNRYLVTITLSGVNALANCSDVEAYIADYVTQIGVEGLPPSLDK
jgi:hypothetical protein